VKEAESFVKKMMEEKKERELRKKLKEKERKEKMT
jgi:hypothetical protein